MQYSKAMFAFGPFLLLATSWILDWMAIRTFNEHAETLGLQRIQGNFFMNAGALGKIRKLIPQRTVRTKIIALQILSFCCTLGFGALMFLSIKHK
jgi:hypothetical protein